MQERSKCLLLGVSQRRQKLPDGGKASLQEFLAKGSAPLAQVKCDRPLVASLATLNESICDEPINEAHCSRVGQAKNASQLIVGRAGAVSDDDERRGRFTGVAEDVARRVLDAIGDSKPNDTEQIGSTVDHRRMVGAERTFFNLTVCA